MTWSSSGWWRRARWTRLRTMSIARTSSRRSGVSSARTRFRSSWPARALPSSRTADLLGAVVPEAGVEPGVPPADGAIALDVVDEVRLGGRGRERGQADDQGHRGRAGAEGLRCPLGSSGCGSGTRCGLPTGAWPSRGSSVASHGLPSRRTAGPPHRGRAAGIRDRRGSRGDLNRPRGAASGAGPSGSHDRPALGRGPAASACRGDGPRRPGRRVPAGPVAPVIRIGDGVVHGDPPIGRPTLRPVELPLAVTWRPLADPDHPAALDPDGGRDRVGATEIEASGWITIPGDDETRTTAVPDWRRPAKCSTTPS